MRPFDCMIRVFRAEVGVAMGVFPSRFGLALLCTCSVMIAPARAGSDELKSDRFYVSISGGYNHLAEADISGVVEGTISFDDGWAGYAALGYRVVDHVRLELEFGMATAKLDHEELKGIGRIDLAGDAHMQTGLVKAVLDVNPGGLSPFIALGAGVARFSVDLDSPVSGTDDDVAPALLLEAGTVVPLSGSVDLQVSGRYLLIDDVRLDPTNSGDNELSDISNISAIAGLMFRF